MGFAYPIDSKVNIGADGSIDYDRASNSQDLRGFMKTLISNGIVLTESTNLQVVPSGEGDMTVIVQPGFVVIEGAIKHIEEPIEITLGKAHATYTRIDRVVARLDLNEAVRDIVIDVLPGTAEAQPTAIELTRNDSVYELCLAEISVEGGTIDVNNADITDTRLLNDVCGMCSSLGEIDTQTLYQQMTTQFEEWFANVKIQLDGDVAGNLQNQIDDSNINIQQNAEELAKIKSAVGFSKKQLIPYPYYETTHTENGITFTDNGDGTVTANGTATANAFFIMCHRTYKPLNILEGRYILNGCVEGGSEDTYSMYVGDSVANLCSDYGSGAMLTIEENKDITIGIKIASGVTVNNLVFKPMLRYASIEDDTFESYVADVQTQIASINDRILVGNTTINGLTGNAKNNDLSISFGKTFKRIPVVLADIRSNGEHVLYMNDPSTTGFKFDITMKTSATSTMVTWIAIANA